MENVKKHSREEIKKIIIQILKPFGVSRIALFGSFAREQGEFNDIDILVSFPDLKNRKVIGLKWFVLDQELEKILGVPVDLVTEASLNRHLRSIIQKDLKVIYEKAG